MKTAAPGGTLQLLGVGVLVAVTRLSSYRVPINRDTGQMLYGGMVILHGGAPYRDAALNKGPLTYVMFAILLPLVGRSEVAVRLSLVIFAVITALALGACLRRMVDPLTGWCAALMFALLAGIAAVAGNDPNYEQYGVALMAVALWLAAGDSRRSAAAAGAATAMAALFSPDLVLPVVPAVLVILWRGKTSAWDRYCCALAGGVSVVLAVGLWLLLAGALPDLFTQVPGTSGGYIASGSLSIARLVAVPARGLWLTGTAATLLAFSRSYLRKPAGVALLWIVICWLRVKIGDHLTRDPEYPQHYYPALIGLSAGLALGLRAVWPGRASLRAALLAALFVPLAITLVVLPERDAMKIPTPLRGADGYPWGDAYPIADYLDRHTWPVERIYVTGSQPEVYWLADRFSATRFFDVYPIFAHPAYDHERIMELARHPAAAIVAMPGYGIDAVLAEVMQKLHYRLSYTSPDGQIWLLPRFHPEGPPLNGRSPLHPGKQ